MLKILLIAVALVLFFTVCILAFLHYRTQHLSAQSRFLKGKIPSQLPGGAYQGKVNFETTWQGKEFDAVESRGINNFLNDEKITQLYPFKTYVADGIADPNLQVIKIDYDLPENPFWLRHVLDEIVEVGPDHYLGKVHLRVFPGLSFALGYFELIKH